MNQVRSEDGSLTILSLFLFVLIVMICGMAVDIARQEHKRVEMQNVVDAAVLSAASATQTMDSKELIESHLVAAGIDPDDVEFDGSSADGTTIAWARGTASTNTLFMDMLGIEELNSPVESNAREKVSSVEISLVLDYTSSMYGTRIDTLRESVASFLATVYGGTCIGGICTYPADLPNITVNVVPYGGTVNPGAFMAELLGLERWHHFSDCAVLPANSAFDTELPYGAAMQMPHFYRWHRSQRGPDQAFGWCPHESTNRILYAANNPTDINTYMSGLELNDGTGTAIGMKWGMALLDPSSRDEINLLIDEGIATGNTSRSFPEDHGSQTLKIVVLMTDGGITPQKAPRYIDPAEDSTDQYDFEFANLYNDDGTLISDENTTIERDRVLERFGPLDVSGNIRSRTDIEEEVDNSVRVQSPDYISKADEITYLDNQCDLARATKANGEPEITVFTIRFLENNPAHKLYMERCATQPIGVPLEEDSPFFHDVSTSAELATAFIAIGQHINNLKISLTN